MYENSLIDWLTGYEVTLSGTSEGHKILGKRIWPKDRLSLFQNPAAASQQF